MESFTRHNFKCVNSAMVNVEKECIMHQPIAVRQGWKRRKVLLPLQTFECTGKHKQFKICQQNIKIFQDGFPSQSTSDIAHTRVPSLSHVHIPIRKASRQRNSISVSLTRSAEEGRTLGHSARQHCIAPVCSRARWRCPVVQNAGGRPRLGSHRVA